MTDQEKQGLKNPGTVLLTILVIALGVWIAMIGSELDKMRKRVDWLETRVVDASNKANDALNQTEAR
jgi:hypothetical protein